VNQHLVEGGAIEFKFVCVDAQKRVTWEGGSNHKLHLNDYLQKFNASIDKIKEAGGMANLQFPDSADCLSYDMNKRHLVMMSPWRL
jgi:hypothetical protein